MRAKITFHGKRANAVGPEGGMITMEKILGYNIRYSGSRVEEFSMILENESYDPYKISDYSWIKFVFITDNSERFEFEFF
jgi:hypothetical protein